MVWTGRCRGVSRKLWQRLTGGEPWPDSRTGESKRSKGGHRLGWHNSCDEQPGDQVDRRVRRRL